mmetsp:Transcript_164879/g.529182  ORF Transcript_164879/g.529182 Transcript_164879/m.529182 type:complete len:245 (-) Transcript_164879:897-1631(-)
MEVVSERRKTCNSGLEAERIPLHLLQENRRARRENRQDRLVKPCEALQDAALCCEISRPPTGHISLIKSQDQLDIARIPAPCPLRGQRRNPPMQSVPQVRPGRAHREQKQSLRRPSGSGPEEARKAHRFERRGRRLEAAKFCTKDEILDLRILRQNKGAVLNANSMRYFHEAPASARRLAEHPPRRHPPRQRTRARERIFCLRGTQLDASQNACRVEHDILRREAPQRTIETLGPRSGDRQGKA